MIGEEKIAPGSHLLVLLPTSVVQLNPCRFFLMRQASQPVMLSDSRVVADTLRIRFPPSVPPPTKPKGKIISTVDAAVLTPFRERERKRERELSSSVALHSSAAHALPVPCKLASAFHQH